MSTSAFRKAERGQTKLRMAITGPAGSGKTLGALMIARGLVGPKGRIAVIDTENASASYYSDRIEFDTLQLSPPYLVSKYVDAMHAAELEKCDVVIVDSISHAWSGEGGVLQRKEQLDSRGGNSFANWGKMTPEQNALVNMVLNSKTNIICTMRSKMEYALEKDDKGKATPKKLGLAPVQRDGFEYEFDVVLDIDLDTHTAKASKDRTGVFSEKIFQITENAGAAIAKWQSSGKAVEAMPPITSQSLSAPKIKVVSDVQTPPESLGDYVAKFGQFGSRGGRPGTKLSQIPRGDLEVYLQYLENGARNNNEPLSGIYKEFFQAAKAYLEELNQDNIPY